MWDLDTIIRENNRVALLNMLDAPEQEEIRRPQLGPEALQFLARKMRIGPPLLENLLDCFHNIEDVKNFVSLVRQFLPEYEEEILNEPRFGRVHKFCHLFGQKHYPLPTFAHEMNFSAFIDYMPVALFGMSYSAYHENLEEMRPGFIIMMALVCYPYEGGVNYWNWDDDAPDPVAARLPILDLTKGLVGEEPAAKIPSKGWAPEALHKMTDDTKYSGLASFADWACQETGCIMLDTNYSDCDYREGEGEPLFRWSEYNVSTLAEQYPKVQEIRRKIGNFAEWLEKEPRNNFRELLEFLLSQPSIEQNKPTTRRNIGVL